MLNGASSHWLVRADCLHLSPTPRSWHHLGSLKSATVELLTPQKLVDAKIKAPPPPHFPPCILFLTQEITASTQCEGWCKTMNCLGIFFFSYPESNQEQTNCLIITPWIWVDFSCPHFHLSCSLWMSRLHEKLPLLDSGQHKASSFQPV